MTDCDECGCATYGVLVGQQHIFLGGAGSHRGRGAPTGRQRPAERITGVHASPACAHRYGCGMRGIMCDAA